MERRKKGPTINRKNTECVVNDKRNRLRCDLEIKQIEKFNHFETVIKHVGKRDIEI